LFSNFCGYRFEAYIQKIHNAKVFVNTNYGTQPNLPFLIQEIIGRLLALRRGTRREPVK
jgi:hypothetical protein